VKASSAKQTTKFRYFGEEPFSLIASGNVRSDVNYRPIPPMYIVVPIFAKTDFCGTTQGLFLHSISKSKDPNEVMESTVKGRR
jgi:hypothetical protein